MAQSADVVVIGGGVNGVSTAFHLAKRGAKVALLERTVLAGGATGKSGAVVRMHYTNPHDSALAQQSLPYFQRWEEMVGPGDPGFVRTGVLRIVPPRFNDRLRANVEMLRGVGVNTTLVTADDVRELDPGAFTGDFEVAAWEPESGYADATGTVHGFAQAARDLGGSIHEGVEATAVLTDGERVTGVETRLGRIDAGAVVMVTGAHSNALLAPLGLDYGLRTNRCQVVILRRTLEDSATHPLYIDGPNNTWIRPVGNRESLVGIARDQLDVDPDLYAEGVEQEYLVDSRRRGARRRPALAGSFMHGGWAGVFTMSPDGHAIIGPLEPYRGLFGILGDCGTNFKTAPAIGSNMAAWILDGAPDTVDLRPFRATRFAEGELFAGEHEYGDSLLDVFR